MTENTLVKQTLDILIQLGPEKSEWLGTVKLILTKLGLLGHFQNVKLVKTSIFKEIVKSRLKLYFVELWHAKISGGQHEYNKSTKLRFYKLFKKTFEKEPYLDIIPEFQMRKIISKFRCIDHVLEIEKGRHKNNKVEERVCRVCNKSIEDEIHFLNNCKKYSTLRAHYFGGRSYDWIKLLKCREKDAAFKLYNYLTKAFKLRKKII